MSTKDSRNNQAVDNEPQQLDEIESMEAEGIKTERQSDKRTIHHINPLGMRVLVRILKEQNVTEGGLYLPEGAKDAMAESVIGEVIEVASALDQDTDEETNVSGVPLGSKILIPKKAGTKVPWDDDLRIVETKDVLATVEVISLS